MKYLLAFMFFIAVGSVKAQTDTIRVYLLCSDMSKEGLYNGEYYITAAMKGYEVRGVYFSPAGEKRDRDVIWFQEKDETTYKHICYLDEKKRPIKYTVWQSKPVQP